MEADQACILILGKKRKDNDKRNRKRTGKERRCRKEKKVK
jgi:hypothetical protein